MKFEYEDYLVQGKMIVARATFPLEMDIRSLAQVDREKIRSSLAHQIADFMLANNCLEIVTQKTYDSSSFGPVDQVAARCFVVPNGDVKIIRSLKR